MVVFCSKSIIFAICIPIATFSFSYLAGDDLKNEEVFASVSDVIGQGLAKGFADGIKEGVPAAVNSAGEAFKNQFAVGGDGYQGMSNIFNSVGDQFDKKGSGHRAIQNFWGAIGDTFDGDGQGRRAAHVAGDSTGLYINKVGSSFATVFLKNALIAVGCALGVATVWFGSRVLWNAIDRNMKKPKVIIKSSQKSFFEWTRDVFTRRNKKDAAFKNQPMIFEPALQERLQAVVTTTQTIHTKIKQGKTNIKYRNVLLYGPPGTGKTLFAQYLAYASGMEFAMATGASFTKKGAIEAMDELFAWAEKSKGLLLFIDEAESLMPDREKLDPDSDNYQVLTNFLNYTGTRSNTCMIVLATNRLQVIDEAIHRRIDDLIELPLPGEKQRLKVLQAYRDSILKDSKQNGALFVQQVDILLSDEKLASIAYRLDGCSNGDLEGLINIIKTESDASVDGILTQIHIDTAVHNLLEKQRIFKDRYSSRTKGVSLQANTYLYSGLTFIQEIVLRVWDFMLYVLLPIERVSKIC